MVAWHFRARCHGEGRFEIVPLDRAAFADDTVLAEAVSSATAVVHLAGMNRGADAEIEATNVALAERLASALSRTRSRARVVYASTLHATRDTPYGRSKRRAGEILATDARARGTACASVVLPHVFGERGRPFYNSVVSTFCHQIASGESPSVNSDGDLELLHAQDAAALLVECIDATQDGDVRARGAPLRVRELAQRLESLAARYRASMVPDLVDPLELRLFNTYRSYLFPACYPMPLQPRSDARGCLFESLRSEGRGQVFLSTTRPGVTRGNHYHRRKIERFVVLAGRAAIRIRRLLDAQVHEFVVDGSTPVYLDMPTLHTHSITNVGDDELLTMFWSNEFFDPLDPDTFPEPVT